MSRGEEKKGKLEAALWESQRMLSTLLSNLPGAAYRCLNDLSWTMDFISEGCFELTGYRAEEILSGRISFGNDIIHPDDRQRVWEGVQQGLSRRERFKLTYRIKHASGQLRWVWEQGLGIFSPQGDLLALEGFIADMTDRVRAQEELERQRFFLSQVIDIMPHFVFAKDRQGRFTLANRAVAEAYGTDPAGLLGRTDSDFNPNAEEVEHFRRDDLEVMDSGREKLIPEEHITDAKGQRRVLQTIKRGLADKDGRVDQVLGVATDITSLKQAEEQLRETADWLQLAQQSAQLGTFEFNPQTSTGRGSQQFLRLFGLESEEYYPSFESLMSRVVPEDQEFVQQHYEFSLSHPDLPFDYEYRVLRPDGGIRWLQSKGQVLTDAEGKPARLVGAVLDITDRKQIEQELRNNDQRIREIFDSAIDAIISIGTDSRITAWNRAAEEMFGWTRDEVIGQRLSETIIPEDLRAGHEAGLQHYLATRDPSVLGRRIELRGLRRSGEEFPVELALSEQSRMGSVVGFTAFLRDLSEQHRALAALRESEVRLELAQRAARFATWDWKVSEGQIFFSDAWLEMFGYVKGDFPSTTEAIRQLLHDEDVPRISAAVRENFEGRQQYWEIEYRIMASDGEWRWILDRGRLYERDGDGRPLRALGVHLDVTNRRKSEERFRNVVEHLPSAMVAVDRKGEIVMLNALTEQLFGYERAELIGMPVEALIPQSLRGLHELERKVFFEHPSHRAMGEGRELFALRRDGSEVPVEIGLSPLETDEGVLVLATIVDITERRRAEERLRQIVEHMPNAIVAVNQRGEIVFINGIAEQLFGYSRSELVGRPVEVLVPERQRRAHVGNRGHFFAAPSSRLMAARQELFALRKDGSEVPVEIGLQPLETDEGTIVLAAVVDVTERRRAEERLRQIVEHMPNAIVAVDKSGQIVLVNALAESLFGYSREELRGMSVDILLPQRFRDRHSDFRRAFVNSPSSRTMGEGRDLYALRKDGSEVPVEIGLQPLETDEGLLVLAAIVDITERRRAEDRLRQIVEHMPNAVVAVNAEGEIVLVNALAEELFGYTRDELKNRNIDMLVPERNRSGHAGFRRGFFAEPSSRSMGAGRELYALHRDGREIPVEIGLRPIEFEEGLLVLAAIVDITHRRETEQALRERESKLREAQRIGNVGSWEADLVADTLEWSEQTFRIFGQDPESFRPSNESFFEMVHPDDRERVFYTSRRAIAGEAPYLIEHRIILPDGSTKTVLESAEIRRDEFGRPLRMIGTVHDISLQREAQQALMESEERYRLLIDTTPVGIFIATDGVIQFANPEMAAMLGYAGREDLMGVSVFSFIHPSLHEIVRERIAKLQEEHEPVGTVEQRFIRRDGSQIYVNVGAVPVEYNGRSSAQVAVWDITQARHVEEERREMERRIQQAQKLESLGVLAGGIAHDFNNLLAGMLGNAGLALMDLSPEHPSREAVENINRAAKSAAELTRQMLAYSGKGRFVIQPINLSKLVEEMVHLLQTVISKKAVLRLDFAQQLPTVEADIAQIRQVVMNLITNASDALGERSGVIMIRTGAMQASAQYLSSMFITDGIEPGMYCYVEVSDTGCGMDEQTVAQIFEPFFSTKFTGRGLGLAAVLGIVRGHRGAIRVYSELGKGTTFKVLLPASEKDETTSVSGEGFDPRWRSSGTILVVDDEDTVRAVAQSILKRFGFEVELVSNGIEGLNTFRDDPQRYRLVIMDLTMPGMSGEELFREMRALRPDVRVILISGYNEQEATNLFVGKGLAGFLQKPFTPAELIAAVRQTLNE